jgi:Fe-S cluster assembly iron-binding protein IscA
MRRIALVVLLSLAGCGTSAPPVVVEVPAPVDTEADEPFPESGVALTARAAKEVKARIAKEPAKDKLRVSIVEKFGGDRHWQAALVQRVDGFDDETFISHGVTMVVDRGSRKFLDAGLVDYKPDAGFSFSTPPREDP